MALVSANQFRLGRDFSQIGKGFAQGQQISNQFELGQQRRDQADRQATQFDTQQSQDGQKFQQEQSLLRAQTLNRAATALKNIPFEQRQGAFQSMSEELKSFNIDPSVFEGADLSDVELDTVVSQTQAFLGQPAQKPGFTLNQGQQRFDAKGNPIASGGEKPISPLDQAKIEKLNAETLSLDTGGNIKALDALVANASPELKAKAISAYNLAGKGDKGVKALQKVLESGVESERRAAAPETLKANFPNASDQELSELQAVVDSAKTTESGFKSADKLRTKQRQIKKGKVFQTRAVDLLDRILGADELNDVLGSIEGSDESLLPFGGQKMRGDNESEIIADIEEAGNILTSDSLDIMTGVLSETDIKIIADLAGGALNRKRGEDTFVKDVTALRERLAGKLGILPEGVTEDDISTTMKANNLSRKQVLERLGRK